MKCLGLLILVLLVEIRIVYSSETAAIAQQHARQALSTIGLAESDLNGKKDLIPDGNLSPLVRELLNHPLSTFEVADRLERDLDVDPWVTQSQRLKKRAPWDKPACKVRDWKATPQEFRPAIQQLLDGLLAERHRFQRVLGQASVKERALALQSFAIENFHLDRDLSSRAIWTVATGGDVPAMKESLRRVDAQEMGETEFIQAQLHAALAINSVELEKECRSVTGMIHDFVESVKLIVLAEPRLFRFGAISLETALGEVLLGDSGTQSYGRSVPLIIDFGGDDVYSCAGCANGITGDDFCIAIDLGGNDRYQAAGSGVWGVGILWDESGNDRYNSSNASLGCGLFGAGVLIDRSGDDIYRGDTLCEGAAAFGYGLLWDGEGDDSFEVALQGQGFAGVNGYGVLFDRSGNDRYRAGYKYPDYDRFGKRTISLSQGFSIGYRPFAPGGLGVLRDQQGNDLYDCDVYGQGVGYWYSCGALLDGEGNDSYSAYQYSQGSGIHLSVGILKDGSGNDRYKNLEGLAQAGSHDFAVGLLWDGSGNDRYSSRSSSQGSGINNAVGILYEGGGDDVYEVLDQNGNGQGSGGQSERRGIGSVGLLVDMSGKDRYSTKQRDNRVAERKDIGVAVDVSDAAMLQEVAVDFSEDSRASWRSYSSRSFPERNSNPDVDFTWGQLRRVEVPLPPRTDREILDMGADPKIGRWLMESGLSGDRPWKVKLREEAKAKLEVISASRFDEVIPWAGRSDPMIRIEIDDLIGKKGVEALPSVRRFAKSDWPELQSLCLWWLRQKGDESDCFAVFPALKNPRVRPMALVALAKIGAGGEESRVLPFLRSNRNLERALSVRILGQGKHPPYAMLVEMLNDDDWNVRSEAVVALGKGGVEAWKVLQEYRHDLSALGRFWAAKVPGPLPK